MKLNKISTALRKQSKSALYTSAMLSMLAAPAYAQAAEEAQATAVPDDVEVIEVRGMRGTMTRSLNEKKNTAAIVDAIAAADFGDLPGLSLSDVIENVSGASGHRLKGSQNEISIRGLGSYWSNATFNGRTITNAGPNRAVNFKKFPSDLIDKVVIYKTQQADLVEGGIAGTIEVGSLRAVDYGKSRTSVEYQGAYNDYYSDADNQSEWGHKLTFSTVQNWETESAGAMGFSFGYVWNDSANPEEVYTTSSTLGACSFVGADGSALERNSDTTNCFDTRSDKIMDIAVSGGRSDRPVTLGPNADVDTFGEDYASNFDEDSIFFIPENSTWRATKDEDKRRSIVTTFQWVPNDEWDINFDLASSRLEYTEERMELTQERSKALRSDTILFDKNGVVLYEEGQGKAALLSESRNQKDDYDGYGLEVAYQANDNLVLTFDASYSESFRDRVRQRSRFRTDHEVAYSLDSRGTVPALYYGNEFTLTDDTEFYFKNEGGNLVVNEDYEATGFDPTNISHFVNGVSDADANTDYRYGRESERRNDDVWALAFDGVYHFDDNDYLTSIKAGVRYSREHLFNLAGDSGKTALNPDGTYVKNGVYETDDIEADLGLETKNNILSCGSNGHSFDGFFSRENGVAQASDYYTYDAKCFIGAMLGGEYYDIGENPNQDAKTGEEFDVREDIMAVFVMANVDTEVMGYTVTGNVGLRYVKTDTASKSWSNTAVITAEDKIDTSEGDTAGDTYTDYQVTLTDPQRTYLNGSYTEFLPSVNLTLALTDEWYVKASAYRAMSRYPLQNMSAGVTISGCTDDGDNNSESESDGCVSYDDQISSLTREGSMFNAYTSSNYDLSLEWYPSQDMAVTLGAYWKDFTGGAETTIEYEQAPTTDVLVDVTGLDSTYTPILGYNSKNIAKDETTIKGFELTWQKHFTDLPAPFDGMGVKGAWNHAVSDFVTEENANYGISPNANIWGHSKDTASASIYWEGDALSMRLMYKYRSGYFQPTSSFEEKTNRFVDDSEFLDASIKYKITKDISVNVKALNLLEEPQVQYRGTGTVAEVSQSGRKIFFGVKAKF